MITIVNMLDLGKQPPLEQIWIVPGSIDDRHHDDGEFSDWYIEDYLRERGIWVGIDLHEAASKVLIEELTKKFAKGGIKVVVQNAIND